MITFIFALLLAALTIASVSLQKTYSHVPIKELKRRARKGDELANGLYRAVAYGASLEVLLWVIIALSAAGFTVVLAAALPDWLAIFGCAGVLWLAFAWLPSTRVTEISQKAAQQAAPSLAWIMAKSYPVLSRVAAFVQKHRRFTVHSGIYQKEDLVELLDRQQQQPDNRMTAYELGIVKSALTFSDKLIRDVMTPRRVVKTVKQTDAVGPVLMTELHKTGFSRFPVVGDKAEHIVGTLFLRDLVNVKGGGTVKDHMKKSVYYVNEEKPLQHALQAFLKTKHHLFVVVNGFEEVVGIITIEDVLEQVVGKQIVDEFDKYEDLRAVAALQAKQDAKQHTHAPEALADKPASNPEIDDAKKPTESDQ
ncbi:CBS domain-containing protein [Candidatus Saccharibacteria bacterium]|nr:MAG: CBS domain-containing protein [Candidatus Saccharibacteria bacterium]